MSQIDKTDLLSNITTAFSPATMELRSNLSLDGVSNVSTRSSFAKTTEGPAEEDYFDNINSAFLEASKSVRSALSCFGIICNILALVIFFGQGKHRRLNASFLVYLKALAIFDIINLIAVPFNFSHTGKWAFLLKYEVACKGAKFLAHSAPTMSAWSLAILSIDRMIAITGSSRAKCICTRKYAIGFISSVVLISTGYFSHNFFTRYVTETGRCSTLYRDFSNVDGWIRLGLYSLLPSVIIILCNLKIITVLRRQAKFRKNHSSARRGTDYDHQITIQLIAASVLFLICTLFYSFGVIWHQTTKSKYVYMITSAGSTMMVINHSFNFFVYALSASVFRNDLKRLVCCKYVSTSGDSSERQTKNSKYNVNREAALAKFNNSLHASSETLGSAIATTSDSRISLDFA